MRQVLLSNSSASRMRQVREREAPFYRICQKIFSARAGTFRRGIMLVIANGAPAAGSCCLCSDALGGLRVVPTPARCFGAHRSAGRGGYPLLPRTSRRPCGTIIRIGALL